MKGYITFFFLSLTYKMIVFMLSMALIISLFQIAFPAPVPFHFYRDREHYFTEIANAKASVAFQKTVIKHDIAWFNKLLSDCGQEDKRLYLSVQVFIVC